MTNYEKIKNMTVAEMVMFIDFEGTCNYCVWLNSKRNGKSYLETWLSL